MNFTGDADMRLQEYIEVKVDAKFVVLSEIWTFTRCCRTSTVFKANEGQEQSSAAIEAAEP